MIYQAYEMLQNVMAPYRACALWGQDLFRHKFNPAKDSLTMSSMAAACDVIEATTRRYNKPAWRISHTQIEENAKARVNIKKVLTKPFADLIHFKRSHKILNTRKDPKVLLIAPMSGHHATLLRGTVETLIEDHDVYVTDWRDARNVPLAEGKFGVDEFIAYLIEFIQHIGPDTHVIAVCQPGPLALCAVSLMSEDNDPCVPASMVFMGSPIDPRKSPTVPNELATEKPIEWFKKNVINTVPLPYPGVMRHVYPGFLQLTGFMSMNLDRHYSAHIKLFQNLVQGDGDSVEKHRIFYDEYLSVMDMTEEFYLETIERVFQKALLPKGQMMWRGRKVNPKAITRTALMTVEGKKDDISGVGQTKAAHKICSSIPENRKIDYLHPTVGHYGVFNGSKWRRDIKPKIGAFFRQFPKPLALSDIASPSSEQVKSDCDAIFSCANTSSPSNTLTSESNMTSKKTPLKTVAKKTVAKKPAAKPVAKKTVAKKPAAKPVEKKTVAKKPEAKPVAKKTVAKKPAAKPVAKKTVAKKPAAKPVAKKTVAKKPEAKPVAKKTVAKKQTTQDKIQKAAAAATKKVIAKAATSASRSAKKVTPKAPARTVRSRKK